MNAFYIAGGGALGLLGVIGGVLTVFRWFYNRGAQERGYKIALDANTESNKELTGAVSKVVDKLNEHDRRLDHAEWRIERLEAAPSVNVSVTPHRDASPAG